MALPTFTVIPISDVDPDSPLDTTLMTALRNNDIHLEEWLGKSYVAAEDHDHDGVNSKEISAARLIWISRLTEESTTNTTWTDTACITTGSGFPTTMLRRWVKAELRCSQILKFAYARIVVGSTVINEFSTASVTFVGVGYNEPDIYSSVTIASGNNIVKWQIKVESGFTTYIKNMYAVLRGYDEVWLP